MVDRKTSIEQDIIEKVRARTALPASESAAPNRASYIAAIRNSTLAHWCSSQGVAISIPRLSPSEERVITYLVNKMLAAGPGTDTSYIEEDMEWMVCCLYDLTDEERVAVTTSQWSDLPPLTEEEEDIAMIRAIEQGKTWEQDEEFLKHEKVMRKLMGRDEC